MPTQVATALVESLAAHQVDLVYCVPGESFLPITDAMRDRSDMELIVCRTKAVPRSWPSPLHAAAVSLACAW